MDFSKLRFRCSSLGHIMTEPKGKSPLQQYNDCYKSYMDKSKQYEDTFNKDTKTAQKLLDTILKLKDKLPILEANKDSLHLSDSCKTHLSDIYTFVKYNRTEDIKSKYLEKGLTMEEDAIDLYSFYTGIMHRKNKERKFNEFIEGESDLIEEEYINDTKVNWSIFQFNRVISRPIKPLYHWQLDGYMELWNKPKGRLVYCLLNTPDKLITYEQNRLKYEFVGSEEDYKEACEEIRKNHTYDEIPTNERIRTFEVEYSKERIDKLYNRIIDCRKYLNNIDAGLIVNENEEDVTEN